MVKHNAKKISRSLTDSEALIEAVEHFRFLPFFRNPVAGWSVEDMTPSFGLPIFRDPGSGRDP